MGRGVEDKLVGEEKIEGGLGGRKNHPDTWKKVQ